MEAAEGQTEWLAGQSLVARSPRLEGSYILEVRTASWSELLAEGPTGIPRVGLVMEKGCLGPGATIMLHPLNSQRGFIMWSHCSLVW